MSNIIYFISSTSFLTILDFNVFDIEIKVYYASFQMLHTEVVFLDLTIYIIRSNNYYS